MKSRKINTSQCPTSKNKCWVVAANHTGVKIYEQQGSNGTLKLVRDINHSNPASSMGFNNTTGDERRLLRWSGGYGRQNSTSPLFPVLNEEWESCRLIAKVLAVGRIGKRFDELILVASPRFLGMLLAVLDRPTKALVKDCIAKDLCGSDNKQISRHVNQRPEDQSLRFAMS